MDAGVLLHEALHVVLLLASAFNISYSLAMYRRGRGFVLSGFWIQMMLLSFSVAIAAAYHVLAYWGLQLPIPVDDVSMAVLFFLTLTISYSAVKLKEFQRTALEYLRSGPESPGIVGYFLALTAFFKGGMGFAVAYQMGRSYAEKLFSSLKGDLNAMRESFEKNTGISYVVLSGGAAVFRLRKSESLREEALEALANFARGYWERVLELSGRRRFKVKWEVKREDTLIEIKVTP